MAGRVYKPRYKQSFTGSSCRPLRVNKLVFVLPSRDNKYLDSFLSRCSCIISVSHFMASSPQPFPGTVCIKGVILSYVTKKDPFIELIDDIPSDLCVSSPKKAIKVQLSEQHIKQLKNPGLNTLAYIYGNGFTVEESEGCPIMISSTTSPMMCVFVSKRLYTKLKKSLVPATYVSSLKPPAEENCKESIFPCRASTKFDENVAVRHEIGSPHVLLPVIPPRYVHLKDLRKGSVVNVAGCLRHFKPPSPTRTGRGYYQSFTITDMSLPPGKEVSVTVFGRSESDFSAISRVGDILLLRSVGVNTYKMSMQITCKSPNDILAFGGSMDSEGILCRETCRSSLSSLELQIVRSLKEWASRKGALYSNGRICKLRNVVPGLHFDLECKIASIQARGGSVSMRIYDETASCDILVHGLSPSFHFAEGMCVYLYNVHAVPVYNGTKSFQLHLMQHMHRGICFSVLPPMPFQHVVTRQLRLSSAQPFTPLGDLLKNDKVPNIYRCSVQVTGIETESIEDCIHLLCSKCGKEFAMKKTGDCSTPLSEVSQVCVCGQPDSRLMYSFIIPLYITDHTASMIVHAVRKEAETLLGNLKPSNPYLDCSFKNKFLSCIVRLLGRDPFACNAALSPLSPPPLPPVLDCCIISYYVRCTPRTEEERKIARVRYQINSTQMIT